jgi:hypothetical protein
VNIDVNFKILLEQSNCVLVGQIKRLDSTKPSRYSCDSWCFIRTLKIVQPFKFGFISQSFKEHFTWARFCFVCASLAWVDEHLSARKYCVGEFWRRVDHACTVQYNFSLVLVGIIEYLIASLVFRTCLVKKTTLAFQIFLSSDVKESKCFEIMFDLFVFCSAVLEWNCCIRVKLL